MCAHEEEGWINRRKYRVVDEKGVRNDRSMKGSVVLEIV
jgi:hypothetical protein